jgi:hypothetical protein
MVNLVAVLEEGLEICVTAGLDATTAVLMVGIVRVSVCLRV